MLPILQPLRHHLVSLLLSPLLPVVLPLGPLLSVFGPPLLPQLSTSPFRQRVAALLPLPQPSTSAVPHVRCPGRVPWHNSPRHCHFHRPRQLTGRTHLTSNHPHLRLHSRPQTRSPPPQLPHRMCTDYLHSPDCVSPVVRSK